MKTLPPLLSGIPGLRRRQPTTRWVAICALFCQGSSRTLSRIAAEAGPAREQARSACAALVTRYHPSAALNPLSSSIRSTSARLSRR